MSTEVAQRAHKTAWQRQQRRAFVEVHGYSTASHYATAGRRQHILQRDGHKCVRCGMTDAEHKAKWHRPITIDHVDKDRRRNEDDNLQTLCLACHGSKDLLPALRVPRVEAKKTTILAMRTAGHTYRAIADQTGFSIAAVWKWARRWTQGGHA